MKSKKMQELAEFIKTKRIRLKFQTLVDVAAFAKTRGINITSESFRLFEVGERIPNKQSRAYLATIYSLSDAEQFELERLCARALVDNEGYDEKLIVIDSSKLTSLINSLEDESFKSLADLKKKLRDVIK
jgi:hypothetical protein